MTSQIEFGSLSNPEDAEQLRATLSQCFNFLTDYWSLYSNRLGLENFRVVRQAGQIIGGLGIYQMGQWFGGRCLPMAGLAVVGIAPEHRGKGVAVELLSHTLNELYAKEVPLSTLYASTLRVYRKVGYEQAGTYCGFELPTDGIGLSERVLPMCPVVPIRHEVFHQLYRQQAIRNPGNLERNQAIWEQVVQPRKEQEMYAYLVGNQSQPEGYVIFTQRDKGKESQILVSDWVAVTPAAGRRLWTFLSDHRSLIEKVVWWRGRPALEPLLLLLPEQNYKVTRMDRWLLRVIDVAKALSMRGYPEGIEAELHLAVEDELLPQNNDKFVLTVAGGRGEVTKGGRGDLQLNVRGLAPFYTGLFTPHQLQRMGHLEVTDDALTVATQLFAGSEPWMADVF